ncbi:phosphoethanolamine transferase [Flavobacterium caeni]|uniref:Lipid A ethanolaminephosphotransferase n=1 Tax=Flavobacterium caeni TaxID=490189 RepID=A0A1G5CJM8_9FLAO|nr:phosphoethanolamine transferase [Flavobacterium caeni]SCY02612.1 lipid A ethanolaminephosphotransferase [Flavobacterium caeni]
MEVLKKYKPQLRFHLLLNVVFGLWITYASFVHYPLNDLKAYVAYFGHFLLLQFSVFGFLYLMALRRWLFVLVFPPVFLLLSVAAFWVYTQDIAIAHGIVRAAFETKPDVAADLISLPFAIHFLLSVGWVVWLVKGHRKITHPEPLRSPLMALALVGIVCFYLAEHFKYGIFTRRLPYNVAVAVDEYAARAPLAFQKIDGTLASNKQPINVVFVLGETVRADHMQLNGYARQTNPLLAKRHNIVSFADTYTPMTYTAESLQQLFTDAAFDDDYSQPKYSLFDVLRQAQIPVHWIGNQTPEISYESFIDQCATQKILDPFHSELSFRKGYDQELLPEFEKSYRAGRRQFHVLHMMGSHWWYETRYPDAFRKFQPVIKSKLIGANSMQEMVNSYDNTILYLDYFLDKTIARLEKEPSETLLIYLSDHGEMLGEDGRWLHAQPGKGVSNPALLVWYSDGFAAAHPQVVQKLQAMRNQKIDLDFLFPSVLGLYGIEGIPYDHAKNVFR